MTPSLSTILLAHFPKLTYRRYQKILKHPALLETIADSDASDLIAIGWEEDTAREFCAWRNTIEIESLRAVLEKERISIITCDHPKFPRLLAEINDPPAVLFVRGTIPSAGTLLAIVGTRKNTQYGKHITTELSLAAAEQHLVLVSGLALGTDSLVHEAALRHNQPTIAVLGSGVDRASIYPRAHLALAERIIEKNGAVISEYPPGFAPTPYSFPARNRIIAGLCRTTLVTEAPKNSGALITARAALDYNRDVLAVPHPITSPAGEGTNLLIKEGAHVILSSDDIFEALQLSTTPKTAADNPLPALNEIETKIFSLLSHEPLHIDRLCKEHGFAPALLASTLLLLEMKGIVTSAGGWYSRR